jgi:tetratricopeptide (TPR) repeat protein
MKIKVINILIAGFTIIYNPNIALSEQCIDQENTAKESIRQSPNNTNAYYDLGAALICQDRLSEALEAYRQGVNLDVNFTQILATQKEAETYTIFGYALSEQKKLDAAINAYNKAIELTPYKIELYNRSATLSIEQNNWEAATLTLQKAIQIDLQNSNSYGQTNNLIQQEGAYQLLAKVLIRQNKVDEAFNIYLRLSEVFYRDRGNDKLQAYLFLGEALVNESRFDEAIIAYQNAILLDPKSIAVYNLLGKTYLQNRQLEESIKILTQGEKIDPNNGENQALLDQAQQSLSQSDQPLNSDQIQTFRQQMQEQIETIIGLLGLGKLNYPSIADSDLIAYRKTRTKIDADTASFLGTWDNDWELFPPFHSLKIFPSQVKGRICLLEAIDNNYRQYGSAPGEIISPNPTPKLSIAKIDRGKLAGSRWRGDRTLMEETQSEIIENKIEFLAAINWQDGLQLYSAKTLPHLTADLPRSISEKFKTYQCLEPQ